MQHEWCDHVDGVPVMDARDSSKRRCRILQRHIEGLCDELVVAGGERDLVKELTRTAKRLFELIKETTDELPAWLAPKRKSAKPSKPSSAKRHAAASSKDKPVPSPVVAPVAPPQPEQIAPVGPTHALVRANAERWIALTPFAQAERVHQARERITAAGDAADRLRAGMPQLRTNVDRLVRHVARFTGAQRTTPVADDVVVALLERLNGPLNDVTDVGALQRLVVEVTGQRGSGGGGPPIPVDEWLRAVKSANDACARYTQCQDSEQTALTLAMFAGAVPDDSTPTMAAYAAACAESDRLRTSYAEAAALECHMAVCIGARVCKSACDAVQQAFQPLMSALTPVNLADDDDADGQYVAPNTIGMADVLRMTQKCLTDAVEEASLTSRLSPALVVARDRIQARSTVRRNASQRHAAALIKAADADEQQQRDMAASVNAPMGVLRAHWQRRPMTEPPRNPPDDREHPLPDPLQRLVNIGAAAHLCKTSELGLALLPEPVQTSLGGQWMRAARFAFGDALPDLQDDAIVVRPCADSDAAAWALLGPTVREADRWTNGLLLPHRTVAYGPRPAMAGGVQWRSTLVYDRLDLQDVVPLSVALTQRAAPDAPPTPVAWAVDALACLWRGLMALRRAGVYPSDAASLTAVVKETDGARSNARVWVTHWSSMRMVDESVDEQRTAADAAMWHTAAAWRDALIPNAYNALSHPAVLDGALKVLDDEIERCRGRPFEDISQRVPVFNAVPRNGPPHVAYVDAHGTLDVREEAKVSVDGGRLLMLMDKTNDDLALYVRPLATGAPLARLVGRRR